ncbi:MAG TPA: bifunctional protein-serine/threonine kinase/phosphatase [Burkholderiales bacterium]|nr:bifunctional protein-serine/threonine kinase/phosphatase [Burkholderiales bacterium]
MSVELKVSIGQYSDKGRKEINQDFHGAFIPKETQLRSKGIVIALADGISSSEVGHVASESAVKTFLQDYYCTSDAWSVKTSAQRVLIATNSWLHAQTRQSQYRYDSDKGYVCTLSAIIIKSTTAHLFHVGDTRIFRLRDGSLEQLTEDHRLYVAQDKSYLARALGMSGHVEIDYRSLALEPGDVFILATDGVYEHIETRLISDKIGGTPNLDLAAKQICEEAYARDSDDNLSVQIVRVETLPAPEVKEVYQQLHELPAPPMLEARALLDGYRILREIHGSSRSHIYLATDEATGALAVIKTPSIDLRGDPAYLERFLMEEWVARRMNSAHVLKACPPARKRSYLYVVMEFVEGQTLTQWMIDHPKPDIETVRGIVEQIAKGLQAFHRMEMLHQDLRPENIMIDNTGTVKIIDFGATSVAGLMEAAPADGNKILGTAQYTAPEYFLGEGGSQRSDIFSLGVITYQMLSGKLPYGLQVVQARTKAAQKKLKYRSIVDEDSELPLWVDGALAKAVHPEPHKRYQEVSEFVWDLRHPNSEFLSGHRPPLIERNPLLFWKVLSLLLAIAMLILGAALALD